MDLYCARCFLTGWRRDVGEAQLPWLPASLYFVARNRPGVSAPLVAVTSEPATAPADLTAPLRA